MKQALNIVAFGFLGLVVSTIVHAVVELVALHVIFGDPDRFAASVWWQEWALIHGVFSVVLWAVGLVVGLYLGTKWWQPYGRRPGFFHWRGR